MNLYPGVREFIRNNFLLILILAFSVILSCYRLRDCLMTMDEFFSINIAQRSLGEIWSLKPHPADFYFNRFPPLYETLLYFVWRISNEGLLWARLLSVFFNTSAVFFVFLVSKLLFDKKTALIAASLTALNYAYIFFPKMIRCYPLLNLLGLASFYIFFRIANSRIADNKNLIFLLFINVAILYTFYFGAFVILLELALSCFFLARRDLLKMWLGLLSSFIFFLPWSGHLSEDLAKELAFHLKISDMRYFMDILSSRLTAGIFYGRALLILYSVIVIYFILNLSFRILKKSRDDGKALFVISLLIILLIPAAVINYLTAEVYKNSLLLPLTEPGRARYSFAYIFPVFILAGFFIKNLPKHVSRLVFIAIVAYSLYVVGVYFKSPNQRFWPAQLAPIVREAKDFRLPETDKVIVEIEDSFFVPLFVYYFYGPGYFKGASLPYEKANLRQLNKDPKNNYKIAFNAAGAKKFHSFNSVAHLPEFDWLFLIYSNWLETCWGRPFREIYEEKLIDGDMQKRVSLVKKSSVGAFTLEIYKIKRK